MSESPVRHKWTRRIVFTLVAFLGFTMIFVVACRIAVMGDISRYRKFASDGFIGGGVGPQQCVERTLFSRTYASKKSSRFFRTHFSQCRSQVSHFGL